MKRSSTLRSTDLTVSTATTTTTNTLLQRWSPSPSSGSSTPLGTASKKCRNNNPQQQLTPSSPTVPVLSAQTKSPLKMKLERRDSGISLFGECGPSIRPATAVAPRPALLEPCRPFYIAPVIQLPPLTPLIQHSLYPAAHRIHFAPSKRLMNLMARQHQHLPNPNYQAEVQQGRMKDDLRPALISWCVSLSQEFEFDSETTHLAVNYLDRYLSTMRVAHVSKHYLLATACVYLASKFGEEIKEPCISDVSVCSMFGSSVKDIKRMEAKVLKELKWELMPVTPQALLSELMESVGETVFPEELKSKLVEECQVYFSLALSRTEFLKFQPAILVFSAVQLVVPVAFQRLDLGGTFRLNMNTVSLCSQLFSYHLMCSQNRLA